MGFLAALHFLTTIPVARRREVSARRTFSDAELGASLAYYPLVGALLGVLLALSAALWGWLFGTGVAAAVTLVTWVLLTGGLHLDGFMDACDGLLSHRGPAERLRIMRDSHVGAWGMLGGVLALLLQFAALAQLFALADGRELGALLLAPVLARWAMCVAVVAFPYGRAEGWGQTLHAQAGRRQFVLATVATLAMVVIVQPLIGMAGWLAVLAALLIVARFALDRLPGLTGDVYGMVAVAAETVVLLVFALRWP
jgi:adenosylcobinamide-GDP ribazoletransferase